MKNNLSILSLFLLGSFALGNTMQLDANKTQASKQTYISPSKIIDIETENKIQNPSNPQRAVPKIISKKSLS